MAESMQDGPSDIKKSYIQWVGLAVAICIIDSSRLNGKRRFPPREGDPIISRDEASPLLLFSLLLL